MINRVKYLYPSIHNILTMENQCANCGYGISEEYNYCADCISMQIRYDNGGMD